MQSHRRPTRRPPFGPVGLTAVARVSPARRRVVVNAPGFTLLEMLITIGIVLILAGLTLVGMNVIGGQARERQTKATLQSLKGITQEVVTNAKSRAKFNQEILWSVYGFTAPGPAVATPAINVTANAGGGSPAGALAVLRSINVLNYAVSSSTTAKEAVERLPPKSIDQMNPGYKAYFEGANRKFANAMVDGWGNPCLFVPDGFEIVAGTTGKTVENLGGASGMTDPSRGNVAIPQRLAPDRGSYWMSAGPDGKYDTADDNLFSFDN